MNYSYLYLGIGIVIVIVGTYLIFQLQSNNISELNNLSKPNIVSQQVQNKTLSGIISIIRDHPDCKWDSCAGDPNSNYEVDVYSNNGYTMIGKTFADADHHYALQLPAGKYIIYTYPKDIQTTNRISIIAGHNTVFNISYHVG